MAAYRSTALDPPRMSEVPLADGDAAPVQWLSAREGYDRWAEVYDTDGNPLIALEERHLDRLLGAVEGLAVVDVGCGTLAPLAPMVLSSRDAQAAGTAVCMPQMRLPVTSGINSM